MYYFYIWILREQVNFLSFIYEKFSFPLLFFIIILVFRKEISNMLYRIRGINFENNAGKVSVLLSDMKNLQLEMKGLENLKEREYGKDLRDLGQLGAGPNSEEDNTDFKYYFNLVNLPKHTMKELARNGHFETIEKLYNAYNFLTKDYLKDNHKSTKVIEEIYNTAMDIKRNGGYLLDDVLVNNYRSFIELTYKEFVKNNNDEKV
ncbi:hypothetical protein IR128_07790 [Staphylococcus lentus]|nr:hypothetical protein [Mammaliicoccus lentus]